MITRNEAVLASIFGIFVFLLWLIGSLHEAGVQQKNPQSKAKDMTGDPEFEKARALLLELYGCK